MAKRKKSSRKRTLASSSDIQRALGILEALESTTLDTLYILSDANRDITLEIKVGDVGQASDMTVKIDNDVIVEGLAGDFERRVIGTNDNLNGRRLNIVAAVADMSQQTNFTSLTIKIGGGVAPVEFPLSKNVARTATPSTTSAS